MPRLNYGTLLENVVVLEATRYLLDQLNPQGRLEFATSFAMPPLTQCWAKSTDANSSPAFNIAVLQNLAQAQPDPFTLQGMWLRCLTNRPAVPFCRFHIPREEGSAYEAGGLNGALLAAMLAAQSERTIRLWINDDGGRYGDRQGDGPTSATEVPAILDSAEALTGAEGKGTVEYNSGSFPATIEDLCDWLSRTTANATNPRPDDHCHERLVAAASVTRFGFLDPDSYTTEGAAVSRDSHKQWLHALGNGCDKVLSAMFFGVQNAGTNNGERNRLLADFHEDEVERFPHSLVFQYGRAATGLKVRWPSSSIADCVKALRDVIEQTWDGWSQSFPNLGASQRLKRLTVHVDGKPGIRRPSVPRKSRTADGWPNSETQ